MSLETGGIRRLANLPGYDTAPDVYETATQANDDDASTTLTRQTSGTSEEEDGSDTTNEEDEDLFEGVSRRRLRPGRARRVFGDGVRRSKGGRDRDEAEGLEARIARLRAEVEECRLEIEREGEETGEDGEEDKEEADSEGGELENLGKLLAGLEAPKKKQTRRSQPPGELLGENGIHDDGDEQTLSRVVDFDSRLAALEQVLGLSTLEDASAATSAPIPVLPSLTLLDQQLSALASATSLANLEAASSRFQKLRSEADALPTSTSASQSTTTAAAQTSEPEATSLSAEDLSHLQSLYTLLPTLQSLAPTVPTLLNRLRSLRTLHTSAADASRSIDDLEQRQRSMDKELEVWRQGLERVEQAVGEAREANGGNGKVVEGWVRELEGRVKGLR